MFQAFKHTVNTNRDFKLNKFVWLNLSAMFFYLISFNSFTQLLHSKPQN